MKPKLYLHDMLEDNADVVVVDDRLKVRVQMGTAPWDYIDIKLTDDGVEVRCGDGSLVVHPCLSNVVCISRKGK